MHLLVESKGLFIVYFLQYLRLITKAPEGSSIRFEWAIFMLLGKFPEFLGVMKFLSNSLLDRNADLIEYK